MSKLFLLSEEEANKIPQDILACKKWWWLRTIIKSKYYEGNYALFVSAGGHIDQIGLGINCDYARIRPAIRLSSDTSNLKRTKKGYIKFGHRWESYPNLNFKPIKWIDISEYVGFPCLLMKKPYTNYKQSNIFEYLKKLDDKFFTDEEKAMIEDFEPQERSDGRT